MWLITWPLSLACWRYRWEGPGRPALAGALAASCVMAAHAVLAARGEWVTNEKRAH